MLVVLTVVLGVLYPLVVTAVAQLTLKHQANGSLGLVRRTRRRVEPDRAELHRRQGQPAAAVVPATAVRGRRRLRPNVNIASNLGPNNPDLLNQVQHRRAAVARPGRRRPGQRPARRGDGAPVRVWIRDISPAYARQQAARVAAARGLDVAQVLRPRRHSHKWDETWVSSENRR